MLNGKIDCKLSWDANLVNFLMSRIFILNPSKVHEDQSNPLWCKMEILEA